MLLKKSMGKKHFIRMIFIVALVILTGTFILRSSTYVVAKPLIVTTFVVNILFSLYMFFAAVNQYAYGMNMLFWLFNVFFFGFAPLLQYLTGLYSWNLVPRADEVVKTNLLIFMWYVFYSVGYSMCFKFKLSGRTQESILKQNRSGVHYSINQHVLNILLICSGLIALYYLVTVGLTNLFVRSTNSVDSSSKTLYLLTTHGFRNTVAFTTAICFLNLKNRRRKKQRCTIEAIKLVFAVFCMLVSCFPTGIARNAMASFYAGMLIIVFEKARKGRWFTFAIIFGLVLLFPMLSLFRWISTLSTVNIGEYLTNILQETYLSGDYDAHQMFISIQRFVEREGFSWGYQLLGVLLFFVPRSIWPTKPYGTGQTTFEVLGQHWFTNVSAPLVSEAYVNFSLIGIVALAFFLGHAAKGIDYRYWSDTNPLSKIRMVYPFVIFQYFFLMRGDSLTCWAFLMGQLIVMSVLHKLTVRVYHY